MTELLPTIGALVARTTDAKRTDLGIVQAHGERGSSRVKVLWPASGAETWLDVYDLTSGFKPGMEVVHSPASAISRSIGWGRVCAHRDIADNAQVLVEFPEVNQRLWMPWQRLRMARGIQHRVHTGVFEQGDSAERLRLRLLAWAIRLWNENTGALATFDIDPLPHQIHVVHHILASGHHNWLVADDVGLGKTVEVGLLLSALRQRGEARRVLLITPAGLTRQWQEEMAGKFGLDSFRIYGDDFRINEARHWRMFDHVIGSMDRLKQEDHLQSLLQAESWDLVIVDEAHRLSRRQYGSKYDSSQRYDMIKALRARTDSILLLTATPHQGREDSFVGLLELLQPDRREELLTLSLNPEIISEMVFRNYKADVTDMEGNFLFHGKTVRQVEVPVSAAARAFDLHLQEYIRRGYAAEAADGRTSSRAIGFVMTVYRKLAASSIAAIHQALVRRRERLLGIPPKSEFRQHDERYQGELEEALVSDDGVGQFFSGEIELLNKLIGDASALKQSDEKICAFMNDLVRVILGNAPKEKVLIFTEYRSTQEWVRDALADRFGGSSTVLIHGGMDLRERRVSIASFEADEGAQFLVSTEAGGEGINLHHRCHIMVNYDLPWNPMRLVQRVGRLYRYGQKKRVIVFNVHQSDTADEQVLGVLYKRLEKVAEDMASVQNLEFNEAMREDILGELADLVDVEDVLRAADQERPERTLDRIEGALSLAREAVGKQKELFQYASGFNLNETRGALAISNEHVKAFVGGMASILGIEILDRTHDDAVWQLRLPDSVMKGVGVSRRRWGISFDRVMSARRPDLLHMNVDCWLLGYLLARATEYDFGGVTTLSPRLHGKAIIAAVARWQNDRGRRVRQELAVVDVGDVGTTINAAGSANGCWRPRRKPMAICRSP
jgi:superfamily II DNA or RNA helicase